MGLTIKRDFLEIKDDFIGSVRYLGQQTAPRQVDGQAGKWQRHEVTCEKHGTFHVIASAQTEVFEFMEEVKIVGGLLYPDRLNGSDVAPSMNVLATKIERVKGGK